MIGDRIHASLHRAWPLYISMLVCFLCSGATAGLDQSFRVNGQLDHLSELGIEHVVFTTRLPYDDGHWYANIAYYCDDENQKAYSGNGKPDESKLYRLDVATRRVEVLLDAKGGSVRDPHVHYDGHTILFSYRPAGTEYYNLYEIQSDGTGLRRVTDVPFDDYEAVYLPDDDIVFASTRSQRWVGCWMTQVGTLFRCNRDGGDLRPLSFNLEQDNTPTILPDGRILYMRWEYVDRSQVGYHQLWTMNPDGTNVMVYYGNGKHYPLYIDAEPIPGSDEILLIESPGHGMSDHRGRVSLMTPKYGPDDERGSHPITRDPAFNDPAPIDETSFLAASYKQIVLGTRDGQLSPILAYNGAANIHEPVLVRSRPREPVGVDHTDPTQATGQMFLADIYRGRNMEGVKPGQIKKLLVLEVLPKPVNFSGGMDLTSWLGTFLLERVLGTVPVEEDGSAFFEVPAGRPVFFVGLDANDMSVKRMQSFTNVMPGESLSCVGCHEQRMEAPLATLHVMPAAIRRPASRIKPYDGLPDVIDFRRHIQPILDKHCVSCHRYEDPQGHVVLSDDLGPCWSISYYTLLAARQVADARNGLGDQKPRTIGSSASGLMAKIDGSHYDAKVTPNQWRTVWLWLETGAPYAGSYGGLRNAQEQSRQGIAHSVLGAPVLNQTCRRCHGLNKQAPRLPADLSQDERRPTIRAQGMAPFERLISDEDLRFSANVLINMSRPQYSPLLLGPLPASQGGWGTCAYQYEDKNAPEYRDLLSILQLRKQQYDQHPRFGTPQFKPNPQYIRELKRFGVLPRSFDLAHDKIDIFETDQRYWKLFWYDPESKTPWPYLH